MLIVETSSSRFDTGLSSIRGQEFLMERVSWLELRLLQLAERMEHTLDLMLKQSNNLFMDHTLIDAVVTLLIKKGLIDASELHELWHANRDQRTERRESQKQIEALREDWLKDWFKDYQCNHDESFIRLIDEAVVFLSSADMNAAMKKLEEAASFSPENVSLNLFLALAHLRDKRTAIARDYIRRAYEKSEDNARITLLYSLVLCEEGELAEAKPLLQKLTRKKEGSFTAHYAFGCLLVLEDKWAESLTHFKKALAARSMPECHYLVASACYYLERFNMAEKHLRIALGIDGDYTQAIYLLGLTLARQGNIEQAKECFNQALTMDEDEKRYVAAVRNTKRLSQNTVIPPLFAQSRLTKKLLLIRGDERLAKLIWKEIAGDKQIQTMN
jgi:Tfp pilus assembly protein PilF